MSKKRKITTKDRDYIVVTVKKKLYPMWASMFITATKDVLGVSAEDMRKILNTVNRYAEFHMKGLVNVHDFRKTIEADLGDSLEDLLRM